MEHCIGNCCTPRKLPINSAFNRDDRDGAAIDRDDSRLAQAQLHGPTGRFRIIGGQSELWCASATMIFLASYSIIFSQDFQLELNKTCINVPIINLAKLHYLISF